MMRAWRMCKQCGKASLYPLSPHGTQTTEASQRALCLTPASRSRLLAASNALQIHSSGTASGKSVPGTRIWKYVNIQAREVPKPPKGQRLPRFYVSPDVVKNASAGAVIQLSAQETKHALRVLRMSEGAWLEICDGRGSIVEAQIRGITHSNHAFATAAGNPRKVEWDGPRWEVVAALGSLTGSRADILVEKITELGAWSLRPLLTQRSRTIGRHQEKSQVKIVAVEDLSDEDEVEEPDDIMAPGRKARWERVSLSATKQSLRAHNLRFRAPALLQSILPLIESGVPALVGQEGAQPLQQVLAAYPENLKQASGNEDQAFMLLVGPEGDFSEQEMAQLLAAGAKPVGMGQNRLRVETAAMTLLAGAVLHWDNRQLQSEVKMDESLLLEATA